MLLNDYSALLRMADGSPGLMQSQKLMPDRKVHLDDMLHKLFSYPICHSRVGAISDSRPYNSHIFEECPISTLRMGATCPEFDL